MVYKINQMNKINKINQMKMKIKKLAEIIINVNIKFSIKFIIIFKDRR